MTTTNNIHVHLSPFCIDVREYLVGPGRLHTNLTKTARIEVNEIISYSFHSEILEVLGFSWSNIIKFKQIYWRIYQHLQHQISSIRFTLKYIFILYIFDIVDINLFFYIHRQTKRSLSLPGTEEEAFQFSASLVDTSWLRTMLEFYGSSLQLTFLSIEISVTHLIPWVSAQACH